MCNDKQTIKIVRGTTNVFSVAITDETTGEAYTLEEGETLRFGIKQLPTDTTYLVTKIFDTQGDDGNYAFALNPDDTISLPFGAYWYDIGLQSGSNYFNVIPASSFEVTYNVTKWEA